MKSLLNLYANWRIDVLFAILTVGMILLIGIHDSFFVTILTKLAAAAAFLAAARLYQHWDRQGLINDLSDLCREED